MHIPVRPSLACFTQFGRFDQVRSDLLCLFLLVLFGSTSFVQLDSVWLVVLIRYAHPDSISLTRLGSRPYPVRSDPVRLVRPGSSV
ncbi:hypothetical protein ACFX2A_010340 [Malus domestica]